jgi:hypothetical protein
MRPPIEAADGRSRYVQAQSSDSASRRRTDRPASQGSPRLSGLLPISIVAVIAAGVSLAWLMDDPSVRATGDGAAVAGQLSPVADQDINGALGTLSGAPAWQEAFKPKADGCAAPLAWVSVASLGAGSEAIVRIQSGSYFSPEFHVTDRPVRIAIPYPAAYGSGHGALTILRGGDVVLALHPPWHIAGGQGAVTREVFWTPAERCRRPDG